MKGMVKFLDQLSVMKENRTAARTMELLELLANSPDGITLSSAANDMNVPVSSLSSIVQTLVKGGYAEKRSSNSKEYVIGLRMFVIGNSYISSSNIIDRSIDIIKELSVQTNKTVFIGKYINDEVTYIYKQEAPEPLIATCEVGAKNELHCTAMGKIILGFSEPCEMENIKFNFTKYTEHTILSKEALDLEIEQVKLQGYAVDNREHKSHMSCFSAPIFDYNNKLVAAISISGLHTDDLDFKVAGEQVKEYAEKISKRMGWKNVK